MSSFMDKLNNLYQDFMERVKRKFDEARDKLTVRPKYIELPEKYYEALKREELVAGTSVIDTRSLIDYMNTLSLKIKAGTLVDYVTTANRELNKVYVDLKSIEKKIMEYIDESLEKTLRILDELRELDIKFNNDIRRVFKQWLDLDMVRERIKDDIDDFKSIILSDYRRELESIAFFEGRINSVLDELNKFIEEVKAETRDRRKILLRYLCFAEGVRTKGVKLYLPAYRLVIRDSRGKIHEVYKIYNGNLKVTDGMINTVKKNLAGVDKEFVDAMKKYIRVNYSGLKRFYLLSVLKSGGRK